MSLKETSHHFCIPSDTTVAKWERIYYEEGPDALLEDRRGRKNMGKKKSSKPKKNVNEMRICWQKSSVFAWRMNT